MKTNNYSVTEIPRVLIDRNPFNRVVGPEGVISMVDSIRLNGIETPLCVREVEGGRYQLIKGERRLVAAGELGLESVPCFVAQKGDTEAFISLVRDNLERENLTPMQEASAYQHMLSLMGSDGKPFTAETIAVSLSRSVEVVWKKLKLVDLPVKIAAALASGDLAERVAWMVGSMPKGPMREQFAQAVLHGEYGNGTPLTVREAERVRNRDYLISLRSAPFDVADLNLLPEPGMESCLNCKWLAGNNPAYANDIKVGKGGAGLEARTCTNPAHYRLKVKEHGRLQVAEAKQEKREVIEGKAAESLFDYNGKLNASSKYVALESKPGDRELGHYDNAKAPTWGGIVKEAAKKEIEVPVKLAVNPKTGATVEIVERQVVLAAARQVKSDVFKKSKAGGDDDNSAEAKARRAQNDREKDRRAATLIGMDELRDVLNGKGLGIEEWELILHLALTHAAADGNALMAKWLQVERPAKMNSNHDWPPHIVKACVATGATVEQLQTLVVMALLSQGLKWNGVSSDWFGKFAKHYGLDAKTFERRATSERVTAAKLKQQAAAAKKGGAAKPKTGLDQTMAANEKLGTKAVLADAKKTDKRKAKDKPESLFVRFNGARKTAGFEALTPAKIVKLFAHPGANLDHCMRDALDCGRVRAIEEYNCDKCACELNIVAPDGTDTVCKLPKGQLLCRKCGGKWPSRESLGLPDNRKRKTGKPAGDEVSAVAPGLIAQVGEYIQGNPFYKVAEVGKKFGLTKSVAFNVIDLAAKKILAAEKKGGSGKKSLPGPDAGGEVVYVAPDAATPESVLAEWAALESKPRGPIGAEALKLWNARRNRIMYTAKKLGVTLPKKGASV